MQYSKVHQIRHPPLIEDVITLLECLEKPNPAIAEAIDLIREGHVLYRRDDHVGFSDTGEDAGLFIYNWYPDLSSKIYDAIVSSPRLSVSNPPDASMLAQPVTHSTGDKVLAILTRNMAPLRGLFGSGTENGVKLYSDYFNATS